MIKRQTILIFFFILASTQAAFYNRKHGPPDYNFTTNRAEVYKSLQMRLDHFTATDLRTYKMRYIENTEFYKTGGPIVIYLGGEWTIGTGYLSYGMIADIGEQHGGHLFYTEHRFYGQSQPFEDWSSENLKYLSIDQALADIAYFILEMKKLNPQLAESKVVVIGGSYSAMLATWMRSKYPHLVDAAWASSAPLQAEVDFSKYYETVGMRILENDLKCYEALMEASVALEYYIQTEEGRDYITKNFNLCTPIKNEFPYKEHFFWNYVEVWAAIVQYATKGTIEYECKNFLSKEGTPVDQAAAFTRGKFSGCIEGYDEFIDFYGSSQIKENEIYRQWYHQICSEIGYLQTTTSVYTPFGLDSITPEYYYSICKDLFGENYTKEVIETAVDRTNMVYGGKTPKLTNVVWIHGYVDPWHPPGILVDLHKDAPARLVPDSAHCQDMSSISSGDSPEMKEAKTLVLDSIARWIQ